MKNRILATIAIASSVIGGGALLATEAMAQSAPSTPVRQGGKREKHPDIRKAIRAMTNAKKFLQEGARDFGGHRANAEKLVDQAIAEAKLALQDDKH